MKNSCYQYSYAVQRVNAEVIGVAGDFVDETDWVCGQRGIYQELVWNANVPYGMGCH